MACRVTSSGGGAIRRRNGEFLFGGDNGINAFYPEQVEDSPHPPQVVLTQLMIMNDVIMPGVDSPLRRDITIADTVSLKHDQNVLSFEFAGLHYGHPAQNRYSYRLEPLDRDWIQTATDRHASYSNLKPGDYTFRVRAANSDGVWKRGRSFDQSDHLPTLVADVVGLHFVCGASLFRLPSRA